MEFGNLNYLYLLWLIPALIAFYAYAFRAKDKAIAAFFDRKLGGRLLSSVSRGRQKFKAFLLMLAVMFIVIALTQPKWGFQWEDIHRKGVDIIIAIDVSRSMLAQDIKPSRLERAKRKIADLLQTVEGDRVGLVAFAGTAFVQCPLTLDYGAVSMFLDYLSPDLIPVPGTNMGQAIRKAVEAFGSQERKSKAIILITDGEDLEEDALKAAQEAKAQGVMIFTIGIGQEGGAPIPAEDNAGGFKKNPEGELVISKLDEATLQKIALETGGSYVRSVTGNLDLEEIYQKGIRQRVEQKELKTTRRKRWEERFQWFLAIAVVLIVWELLYSERKRAKNKMTNVKAQMSNETPMSNVKI